MIHGAGLASHFRPAVLMSSCNGGGENKMTEKRLKNTNKHMFTHCLGVRACACLHAPARGSHLMYVL